MIALLRVIGRSFGFKFLYEIGDVSSICRFQYPPHYDVKALDLDVYFVARTALSRSMRAGLGKDVEARTRRSKDWIWPTFSVERVQMRKRAPKGNGVLGKSAGRA
ncbi:hypothetical protein CQ14_36290 [Bradyrhizobium lablabi]|uniref:Uncharacterized protein n=1 Tax=Bradyrhizobium lablabi TaxID=722472 RepID=A0A0R3MCQ8_9BRAD|nr:hypothetical protein CQ14_36290 [Bradyrhizobium lablabi]